MNRTISVFGAVLVLVACLGSVALVGAHDAFSVQELCELAMDYGGGVPANLVVAIIEEESGGQPDIRSSAGAVGLMQIVQKFHPGVDLTDPATNIQTGLHVLENDYRYLNHMRANLSPTEAIDWSNEAWTKRALAGYVMGPGNVTWYDKHPDKSWPANVVNYANIIWQLYQTGYC